MQKKRRVIDIVIILVVIGLSLLVLFEFDNILSHFNPVAGSTLEKTPVTEAKESDLTPKLTPTERIEPKVAPDFKLETLDGSELALSDFLGKTVMINFWATWCPPCRAELPLFENYAKRFSEDLVILAINSGEEKSTVQAFVDEFAYDLTFLLDPTNSAGVKYQVRGLPTTIFVDPDGNVQFTHIGQLDDQLLPLYLEKLGVME